MEMVRASVFSLSECNALVAVSKDMQALKLYSNKIIQSFTHSAD